MLIREVIRVTKHELKRLYNSKSQISLRFKFSWNLRGMSCVSTYSAVVTGMTGETRRSLSTSIRCFMRLKLSFARRILVRMSLGTKN